MEIIFPQPLHHFPVTALWHARELSVYTDAMCLSSDPLHAEPGRLVM